MDIYEKVKDLALELKATKEFIEWMEVKELIDNTVEEKALIHQYRAYQIAVEFADLADTGDEKAQEALDDIYDKMMKNSLLCRYLMAEETFCHMLNELQRIFAQTMDIPVDEFLPSGDMTGFLN